MDALPVPETADVPYRSVHEGVMHAGGHDGHMAGLLAAARVLHARRGALAGVVKLLFQPAEEGLGGARAMLADGVLAAGAFGPAVDSLYGWHLWSYQPLGAVCCEHGPVMAASDRFEIDVRGRGGHGAVPQGTVDAVVEAAHLVTALQTVVARNKDPLDAGVLTVGKITGGVNYNVIADSVKLLGTARSFTADTQDLIERRMREVCCGVAATFGGEIDLVYTRGYPPTVNGHPAHVDAVKTAAGAIVGGRTGYPQRTMGAEDMSYFLNAVPGAFFFVGAALPGEPRPHHKSVFDFDEDAMLVGASVLVELVERTLAK
jgi:amidohydrolase